MTNLTLNNATPKLVAKAKARAKELGFSSVQDYLTHLILVDKKTNKGMGKTGSKSSRKEREVVAVVTEDKPSNAARIVRWSSVTQFLICNHKLFEEVCIKVGDKEKVLDNKFNTGDTKPDGVNRKSLEDALPLPLDVNEKMVIIVTLPEGYITFLKGSYDTDFGAVGSSKVAVDILDEWFEEDSEG